MRTTRRVKAGIVIAFAGILTACTSSGGSASSSSASNRPTSIVPTTVTVTSSVPATSPSTPPSSATPRPTSTAPGTASPEACPTSGLRLSVGAGVGAGGTGYRTYYLTNTSTTTCTMFGYPGFSALDSAGHIAQHPAKRDASLNLAGNGKAQPKRTITLRPGHRATFTVANTDTVPNPDCKVAYKTVAIQVYPPNQKQAIRTAQAAAICDLRVGYVLDGS
jgi:Protein of unknown function (DUF4232)